MFAVQIILLFVPCWVSQSKKGKRGGPILKLYPAFCPPVPFPDFVQSSSRVILIPEVSYMPSQSRCFPYEKSVVLNALYDTIESWDCILTVPTAYEVRSLFQTQSIPQGCGSCSVLVQAEGRPSSRFTRRTEMRASLKRGAQLSSTSSREI